MLSLCLCIYVACTHLALSVKESDVFFFFIYIYDSFVNGLGPHVCIILGDEISTLPIACEGALHWLSICTLSLII